MTASRLVLAATLCLGAQSMFIEVSANYSARSVQHAQEDWTVQLRELTPADPDAYFLLAEEVADSAGGQEDVDLARHLFALAAVLEPARLGQSACLAMADLESVESERRQLRALAALLAQREGRAPLHVKEESGAAGLSLSQTMTLAVSNAFSYYRRGEGNRAISTLRQAGAIDLLEANDDLIPGGSNRFLDDARRYRGGDGRPPLSERELVEMLRIESALLAGNHRTWSGDLLVNQQAPLVEVDPDRLEDSLGIDARRTIYRNGRWILPPANFDS